MYDILLECSTYLLTYVHTYVQPPRDLLEIYYLLAYAINFWATKLESFVSVRS